MTCSSRSTRGEASCIAEQFTDLPWLRCVAISGEMARADEQVVIVARYFPTPGGKPNLRRGCCDR